MYSGELYSVMASGEEGHFGILVNHEPCLIALKDGVIWGRTDSEEEPIIAAANMGGYLQSLGTRVILLCDKTRQIKDIDEKLLAKLIPQLEEELNSLTHEQFVANSVLRRRLRWFKVQYEAKMKALSGRLPFECSLDAE